MHKPPKANPPLASLPDIPNRTLDGSGGCTVSRWSDGTVHIVDDESGKGLALAPFLAVDVAQRMIAMAMMILQDDMRAMQSTRTITQAAPKLDIVRANLPKELR